MAVASRPEGRFFFECYPHPALIGLFNLDATLAYKVARGTADGWRKLLVHLRSLATAEIQVENVDDYVTDDLAWTKANEDRLDALIAAYTAAYFWWFGTARSVVLGNPTEGYIVTPCNDRTRNLFLSRFGREGLNQPGPARAVRPSDARSVSTSKAATASNRAESRSVDAAQRGIQRPDATALPPIDDATTLVDLIATDPGALWCNPNDWMARDRCEGWRLDVEFIEVDGSPILSFAPFAKDGARQGGMRPADDDTRSEWHFIAAGSTKATPKAYRVNFNYVRL